MTAPTVQPTTHAAKVLLVEDEAKIAHWLATYLRQANFEVLTTTEGKDAIYLAQTQKPDVVLLDLMLPDMDGLDVCRTIRQRSDILILMLTARVEETDRLVGLEIGADDYITKPVSPKEVIARIRAFLRRSRGQLNADQKILTARGLTLNLSERTCSLNGQEIQLTPTEFALLEIMMKTPNVVFSREELITEAMGYDYAAYERTIDAHIRNLRRKLQQANQQTTGSNDDPGYIVTVFGVGYRFAQK